MFRFREQRERDNESLRVVVDNLAGVLDKRGQYAEAEQFYLRDLTIMQDGIKQHHLYKVWIAYPLANLGELYRKQGRHREAEQRFKEALQVMEQQKLNNPTVATTLENYTALLKSVGRDDEAGRLYDAAKARRAKAVKAAD